MKCTAVRSSNDLQWLDLKIVHQHNGPNNGCQGDMHCRIVGSEKYIEAISDCRYRIAMTKLRSSSYTLEVERGRYTKPKTNICERLCPVCNVIEDEIHFLANCKLYDAERTHIFGKVTAKIQNLHELNDADKFILLMSSKDKQILVWTGKFIYKCFNIRSRFYLNYCGV